MDSHPVRYVRVALVAATVPVLFSSAYCGGTSEQVAPGLDAGPLDTGADILVPTTPDADARAPGVPGGIYRCVGSAWQQRDANGGYVTLGDCGASTSRCQAFPNHSYSLPPVLHWTGARWDVGSVCLPLWYGGIAASGASNAWVTGQDTTSDGKSFGSVYAWDGSAWTEVVRMPDFQPEGIWRSDRGVLWVYGSSYDRHAKVLASDGLRWTDVSPTLAGGISAMHGAGDGAPWAVGYREPVGSVPGHAFILRWNDPGWREETPDAAMSFSSFRSVWSAGDDDAWALGDTLYRWDGHSWSSWALGDDLNWWLGGAPLTGFAPNDVWVGDGLHWNGATWAATFDVQSYPFTAFFGREATSLLAIRPYYCWGEGVTLWQWDGASWAQKSDALGTALDALKMPMGRVAAPARDDLWFMLMAPAGC